MIDPSCRTDIARKFIPATPAEKVENSWIIS